jgi:hypothetical protein
MKLRAVLALGLGLVAGTVLSTSAQLPLQHGQAAPLCDVPADAGTPAEHALLATVTRVDAGQGQLEFTTATGAFVLTTPTAITDLRVGDQLVICLHEEASDGKESFAEQARSAEEGAAAAAGAP